MEKGRAASKGRSALEESREIKEEERTTGTTNYVGPYRYFVPFRGPSGTGISLPKYFTTVPLRLIHGRARESTNDRLTQADSPNKHPNIFKNEWTSTRFNSQALDSTAKSMKQEPNNEAILSL